MGGCHQNGDVGNAKNCSVVRGKKRSDGSRDDIGCKGDCSLEGSSRSRSSWEGRSQGEANAALRRVAKPSQPKVRNVTCFIREGVKEVCRAASGLILPTIALVDN